jgi:hypothetical protein
MEELMEIHHMALSDLDDLLVPSILEILIYIHVPYAVSCTYRVQSDCNDMYLPSFKLRIISFMNYSKSNS